MKKRTSLTVLTLLGTMVLLLLCLTSCIAFKQPEDTGNGNASTEMTVTEGENGNWWVDGFDTGIQIGEVGCTSAAMENGHLILTMSDGSTVDVGEWCRHDIEILPKKNPTCTQTGLTEGRRCKICGKVITEQEVMLTVSHQYESGKCKICGDSNGLPAKVDLGGYVYRAYVHFIGTGSGSFYTEDFWIDPNSGASDLLSLAVIERDRQIETDYNCSIHMTDSTRYSQYDEMKIFYNSDQKFDLAIIAGEDAVLCASDGFLSDLNSATNQRQLNLKHIAYDQNSIKQLALGNSLYYLSGDMNISPMDTTLCTVFNTTLFAQNKEKIVEALGNPMYGDLYQMRDDGKWTTENMLKIAGVVTHDEKPDDGALRYDKGDIVGYAQYQIGPLYYYYGTGMRITENVNGYPAFSIASEESGAAYNYVFDLFNIHVNADVPRGERSDRAKNFQAGAILFADYIFWDIRRVLYAAESEVAYGILPLSTPEEGAPSYNAVQFIGFPSHIWSIPAKMQNAENAPLLMQVMAAYSNLPGSTFDAYCQKIMYDEGRQEDERKSRASLDLIRNNLVYDPALMHSWGNDFVTMLYSITEAEQREYDSYVTETSMKEAEKALQDTIDLFVANNQ